MNLLSKLVGADEHRRSRFHTQLGNRVGVADLILTARRHELDDSPWMVADAVRAIDQVLQRSDSLLELGSGASTGWFAQRVASVVSVEPHLEWLQKTRNNLTNAGISNVDLVHGQPQDFLIDCAKFDVVVVDFLETPEFNRADFLAAASLGDVSVVIVDDSDRPNYQGPLSTLPHRTLRFQGFKRRPRVAVETAVLLRT